MTESTMAVSAGNWSMSHSSNCCCIDVRNSLVSLKSHDINMKHDSHMSPINTYYCTHIFNSVTITIESLKWGTLVSRWDDVNLVRLCCIANNLVDITMSSLTTDLTHTRDNTHHYLQAPTRINAYTHSFFPSTIWSWNKCTQQSLDSF